MNRRLHRRLALAAACLSLPIALPAGAEVPDAALSQVNVALQAGEADKALALLATLPENGQNDAQALNLACRVHFTLGLWDAAIYDCERAIQLDQRNSSSHMWLGRALGEKANRASFLTAFSLGKRVVQEFQQATQIDPRNAEALADLGSFYVEAPSVVGGGPDKAQSVALELDRVDPARANELRARIDEQQGNYAAAENDFKNAEAVSHHPAFQWVTLARFYQRRKRWADMDSAIRNCIAAASRDPHAGVALYDAAGVLIKTRRNPELAAKLLQDYLAGSSKTEEAPAFVAYSRLALLEEQMGDAARARISQAAALEMAREYRPAQDMRR